MGYKLTMVFGRTEVVEALERALPETQSVRYVGLAVAGGDYQSVAYALGEATQFWQDGLDAQARADIDRGDMPVVALPSLPPGAIELADPQPDVEKVARVIDPDAWARLDKSLAIARDVLAALGR